MILIISLLIGNCYRGLSPHQIFLSIPFFPITEVLCQEKKVLRGRCRKERQWQIRFLTDILHKTWQTECVWVILSCETILTIICICCLFLKAFIFGIWKDYSVIFEKEPSPSLVVSFFFCALRRINVANFWIKAKIHWKIRLIWEVYSGRESPQQKWVSHEKAMRVLKKKNIKDAGDTVSFLLDEIRTCSEKGCPWSGFF